jgi:hypothetical protein
MLWFLLFAVGLDQTHCAFRWNDHRPNDGGSTYLWIYFNEAVWCYIPVAFIKLWSAGPRRSAGGFGRKSNAKIVSGTERIRNTPVHAYAKTALARWPSTERRRVSSFHNVLSFNHYFIKELKLVYRKNVVMVTLTSGVIHPLFTCMHFWVRGILRKWSACAPTAYEVIRDCLTFEKNCSRTTSYSPWEREISQVRKCIVDAK